MEDDDEFIDQYKEVRRRGNVGDIRKWAVTQLVYLVANTSL